MAICEKKLQRGPDGFRRGANFSRYRRRPGSGLRGIPPLSDPRPRPTGGGKRPTDCPPQGAVSEPEAAGDSLERGGTWPMWVSRSIPSPAAPSVMSSAAHRPRERLVLELLLPDETFTSASCFDGGRARPRSPSRRARRRRRASLKTRLAGDIRVAGVREDGLDERFVVSSRAEDLRPLNGCSSRSGVSRSRSRG